MSLEDIQKTILAEAKKQADEISQAGQKKIESVNAEWQEKIEARKAQIVSIAQRKADQKIQQANFKIQAQNQTEVLKLKQKNITQVYDQALDKLKNLDDNQYVELMTKLVNELPENQGEIISVKDKESLLKKALAQSKQKHDLAKESVNGSGGFLFKSKQIEIDSTFTALVNNAKEDTLLKVSEILFGQAKNPV